MAAIGPSTVADCYNHIYQYLSSVTRCHLYKEMRGKRPLQNVLVPDDIIYKFFVKHSVINDCSGDFKALSEKGTTRLIEKVEEMGGDRTIQSDR